MRIPGGWGPVGPGVPFLQPSVQVRSVLEIGLVALLALQAARLLWLLLTPLGPVGAAAAAPPPTAPAAGVLSQFDPFAGAGAAAQNAQAPDAAQGLRLFGVLTGYDGAGSAIISAADGPQRSYVAGQEVAPGVVLRSVAFDHVTLSRGGRVSRLDFAPAAAPQAPPAPLFTAPAPAAAAAPAGLDLKALAARAGFVARREGDVVTGWTLTPRGDPEALRQAGFQAGDVVTTVNGLPFNPERAQDLANDLTGPIQVTLERGGQTQTVTLQAARP